VCCAGVRRQDEPKKAFSNYGTGAIAIDCHARMNSSTGIAFRRRPELVVLSAHSQLSPLLEYDERGERAGAGVSSAPPRSVAERVERTTRRATAPMWKPSDFGDSLPGSGTDANVEADQRERCTWKSPSSSSASNSRIVIVGI